MTRDVVFEYAKLPESLTTAFVKRHCHLSRFSDELYNTAVDGLLYAASSYDPSRGIPPVAYVAAIITRRLEWKTAELCRLAKHRRQQVLSPEAQAVEREFRLPNDYYSQITPRQSQVICLRFEQGHSFRQIARKIGCSKANAYKLYRRGLRRIERTSDMGNQHDRK